MQQMSLNKKRLQSKPVGLNMGRYIGKMIICPAMNINPWFVGGVSLLRMFTTTQPHGYVNRITWLGISQFF